MTADRIHILARSLVSRGVSVIPVPRGEKRPHVQWGEFQQRVPTAEEIERWFSRGEHNLAIILGAVSGLVAVDSDSEEAEAWARHHLPPTPMMTRTSKGLHRFYRHPGVPVRNKVKIRAEGGRIALDVRGDGGYVIGPYSKHPSGSVYEPMGNWTTPLAELPVFDPAWLPCEEQPPVAHPTSPPSGGGGRSPYERAMAWIEKRDPAVQGQGGDQWTYITSCNLVRDFALSDDEAMAILGSWNQRCVPPWTESDLRKKLVSARRTGSHPDGGKLAEGRECSKPVSGSDRTSKEEEYFQALVSSLEPPGTPSKPGGQEDAAPAATRVGPSKQPTGIVASELAQKQIPPMKWAIVDMLPEGYNILSGRPKQRKSFLALQFALAISRGDRIWGRETHQGTVLYLALEDGPRRMQARQKQLLAGRTPPEDLHFFFSWPRWDEGGSVAMEEWLSSHPGTRMVIIDTWAKVEPANSKRNGDQYRETYATLASLQSLAFKHGLCILTITHKRKPSKEAAGDFLDDVIGSTAVTGAADTIMGLKVERGKDTAELEITGRDVPESELSLSWEDSGWQVRSQMDILMQNPLAKAVINLTMERGEWVGKLGDLYSELDQRVEGRRPLSWPTDAKRLGYTMRSIGPTLYDAGIDYRTFHERGGNMIRLVVRNTTEIAPSVNDASHGSHGSQSTESLMGQRNPCEPCDSDHGSHHSPPLPVNHVNHVNHAPHVNHVNHGSTDPVGDEVTF